MTAEQKEMFFSAPPWDRAQKLQDFLKPDSRVLALSKEDAAFLRAAGHPEALIFCKEPAGSNREENPPVDLVTAFFAPYDLREVQKALRPGGYFLTEQPGADTAAQLLAALQCPSQLPAAFRLENEIERFREAGFTVNFRDQAYLPVTLETAEAAERYVRARPRVFGAFSERQKEQLAALLEQNRRITFFEQRFLLIVRSPR